MNADKRIRYLESQLKLQRNTIRKLRIEIEHRELEIVDLRKTIQQPMAELADHLPRQPSLGELMFGRDA